MVAVGLEQLGAEEFVERGFFDGEVYIDHQKKNYQDLGYRRFNLISIWKAILSSLSRYSEAREQNLGGNLAGDGLQNGGLLIVTKGGENVLLNHREETPGDHIANEVILEKLGITEMVQKSKPESQPESQPQTQQPVECAQNECGEEQPQSEPAKMPASQPQCDDVCTFNPKDQ